MPPTPATVTLRVEAAPLRAALHTQLRWLETAAFGLPPETGDTLRRIRRHLPREGHLPRRGGLR